MTLHIEILDEKRQKLIPYFKYFKDKFYLAGGTGLALMLGHRDSIDFDFFSEREFNTEEFYKKLQKTFKKSPIKKIQEDNNTLTILVDGIKISFFSYPYKILYPFLETKDMKIASLSDIGCMKLSTIIGRSTLKDYVDLYYILKLKNLGKLLIDCSEKFPEIDRMLILKSLVYFSDIEETPIKFVENKKIKLGDIKDYFEKLVKDYLNSHS